MAQKKRSWGCCSTADWASSVPRRPGRSMAIWSASEVLWPAGLGKGFFSCTQLWWGLSTVVSFGPLAAGRTQNCWNTFREQHWSWWKDRKARFMRNGWGNWGCLVWRKLRDDIIIILKGGCSEEAVGIFSQVTSDRVQGNCLKWLWEGLGWISGNISSWKDWSGVEMGCSGRWWCHHLWRCLRDALMWH